MKTQLRKRLRIAAAYMLRDLLLVYAAACLFSVFFIDRLMFHPDLVKNGYDASLPGYTDIGTNGVRIAALVIGPEKGKKALIYCHGNAEDITTSAEYLRMISADGYTAATVDYPGYGLSDGVPTEAGCYRNVHRLYDWLVSERGFAPEDIVVLGFSIGSGPAVELASSRPVAGLILEEAFISAPRVLTRVRLLPADPFPNISRIKKIVCPKLFIHGTADKVVPFFHGKKLYAAAPSPKKFVDVADAGHTDFAEKLGMEAYRSLILGFLESLDGNGGDVP